MKNLTAIAFASIISIVTLGTANADIASKAYVDGKIQTTTTDLNSKQDTANLVGTSDYAGTTEDVADTKYPSVKAVKDAIKTEKDGLEQSVQTLEQSLNDQKGNLVKTADFDSTLEYDDETHYPSVTAVKDAIAKATQDMATDTDLSGKQDKSNLVGTEAYKTGEESDEKYPSVKAVKEAITGATEGLATSTEVDAVEASVSGLGTRVESVEEGLDAKIPAPTTKCTNATNKCVLTFNGDSGYDWEVIERAVGEVGGQ